MTEDTYKIVLTKEKRGIYFTAVPHKWEKEKYLFWPDKLTSGQINKLRSSISSDPEKTWGKYRCLVKCKNIKSFEEALSLEKQLTECTDTEAEEELFDKIYENNSYTIIDRNNLFEKNFENIENLPLNNIPIILSQELITPLNIDNVSDDYNTQQQMEEPNLPDIKEAMLDVQREVQYLKQEVQEIRNELREQGAKIYLLLDNICKKIDNMTTSPKENISIEKQPVADLLKHYEFPLTTCENVSKLDHELRNSKILKEQLTVLLTTIAGTTGQQDATKICFKIIDYLISPEVLKQYSWTGVSRKKTDAEKKTVP